MQTAYSCICRLHTGIIRATCRLHLEKYELHLENVIDMLHWASLTLALYDVHRVALNLQHFTNTLHFFKI